ncbi:MAG: peroxide stress protein YaaA [Owenweeksia sp.]|nr:peroxide stress protein YaaA [Owenweeksia sp.]
MWILKIFLSGSFKVVSFFAKKARGRMADYIVRNKITEAEELKLFNRDAYYYDEKSLAVPSLYFYGINASNIMKKIITLLGVFIFTTGLFAQSRLAYSEFGLGIGTLNYSGEIATTTSTGALVEEARPNVNLFAKRHVNDWFGFGLDMSYGWIYANDLNHTHQRRGLEVNTSIFQVNPFVEINILKFGKFHYDRKFSFYLKGGASYMAYNPDPAANEVYPSNLDPQPDAYTSIGVFGGGGLKFILGYKTILTLEATFHNAGADNLDGVLAKNPAQAGA